MSTARFLKYVWLFYNIMHERVKRKYANSASVSLNYSITYGRNINSSITTRICQPADVMTFKTFIIRPYITKKVINQLQRTNQTYLPWIFFC